MDERHPEHQGKGDWLMRPLVETDVRMHELEDLPVGSIVLTPLGRRAIVKKHLIGSSKTDAFSRMVCQYEGDNSKDLVTLQPHLLRLVQKAPENINFQSAERVQISMASALALDTYGYGCGSELSI